MNRYGIEPIPQRLVAQRACSNLFFRAHPAYVYTHSRGRLPTHAHAVRGGAWTRPRTPASREQSSRAAMVLAGLSESDFRESAKAVLAFGGYETHNSGYEMTMKSGYEIDRRTIEIGHLSSDRYGGGRRLRNGREYQ